MDYAEVTFESRSCLLCCVLISEVSTSMRVVRTIVFQRRLEKRRGEAVQRNSHTFGEERRPYEFRLKNVK